MKLPTTILLLTTTLALANAPKNSQPLDAPLPTNFRLHVEFTTPSTGVVRLSPENVVQLPKGSVFDIALERPAKGKPVLRVWEGGKLVQEASEIADSIGGGSAISIHKDPKLNLGVDFTFSANFIARGNGTILSKCAERGPWAANAKALIIREGKLVYEIGSSGSLTGPVQVNDGKPHTVVLRSQEGGAKIWLDGKLLAENKPFSKPDPGKSVFKIGTATTDFGGDFENGAISKVRGWHRALPDAEIELLFKDDGVGANTPDFVHESQAAKTNLVIESAGDAKIKSSWVQSLERTDHRAIVSGWNEKSMEEGKKIYTTLCTVCHGTKEQPGSLPTALRFTEGPFKNGADPYSMFNTLTNGFQQMTAMPQYTTAQKYAVIQYIRETFLKTHNKSQYTELAPDYLTALPLGMTRVEAEKEDRSPPPWERMDLGSALFWTLQVAPGNIAQKAIAFRLDDGPGGVSKGKAWMVYDHDTMRVASVTTGKFVDWRGIAFDGSHGSHTSLMGDPHFINPVGPGWASPEGKWEDTRSRDKNDLPYGPLPREWAHYKGLYSSGSKFVVSLTVGEVPVLESPGWLDYGATPVFTRTFHVAAATKPLLLRVAPDTINVTLAGDGELTKKDGFWTASLPGKAKTRIFISRADPLSLAALAKSITEPMDLTPLTKGGPARWTQELVTTSVAGNAAGAFVTDTFPLPVDNPWQSWLRPGGFDFTPDGKGAIVAMWNGDVWRVDGIMAPAPAKLTWRRIACGLFQPLGVKFRDQDLFITCRDQLVRLRDLNGDGEIDFLDNFNNDHQVTEHFHEFAMGLQTDKAGNFYYAKSARHALTALVPHHGTLLRISADGKRTDILANGFRAANGVSLNEDGSFFVTDQEGHWTPKNRINRVKEGGFYGNLFGYTSVTDTADSAMEQPMVWITNKKDRSPAELLSIPKGSWGPLSGALLNLSYGTGKAFIVPNEQVNKVWQGAVCELPMPGFATGIMRGRFSTDGGLYTCGMFAWAGSATAPGGFHRIRYNDKAPADVPLAIHAAKGNLSLTFSEKLDPASIKAEAFTFKAWALKRTSNYGSGHVGESVVAIAGASLSADGRTVKLDIPTLAPTHCYELQVKIANASGAAVDRNIHGTIHHLADK